jgi:hypothetical protein
MKTFLCLIVFLASLSGCALNGQPSLEQTAPTVKEQATVLVTVLTSPTPAAVAQEPTQTPRIIVATPTEQLASPSPEPTVVIQGNDAGTVTNEPVKATAIQSRQDRFVDKTITERNPLIINGKNVVFHVYTQCLVENGSSVGAVVYTMHDVTGNGQHIEAMVGPDQKWAATVYTDWISPQNIHEGPIEADLDFKSNSAQLYTVHYVRPTC